jgi:hypothetical protein
MEQFQQESTLKDTEHRDAPRNSSVSHALDVLMFPVPLLFICVATAYILVWMHVYQIFAKKQKSALL